jgi:ABC-type bacteriocin/lantibiotic exporter with double-glycine peptidase domain
LTRRALDASSRQRQQLNGLVSSLVSVRGLFATQRLGRAWSAALREAIALSTRRAHAAALRGVVTSGASRLLGVCITVWGVYRTVQSQLGVGEMLFVTSMSAGLAGAILAIGNTCIGFVALAPQFERMNELLAAAPAQPHSRQPVRQMDPEIVVDAVWYRYADGARWVLQDAHPRAAARAPSCACSRG